MESHFKSSKASSETFSKEVAQANYMTERHEVIIKKISEIELVDI